MTIESKGFIATVADITALAQSLLNADGAVTQGRQTYLRALVATTIADLGAKPRKHNGKAPLLAAEGISRQVGALAAVHERFYNAVLAVASEKLPSGKDRAVELNRRTNFARTSLSTVRAYVRAGHDLTYLVAARLTKRALDIERQPRAVSAGRLKHQLEVRSKAFMASLLAVSETDKATAIGEIELLMGQLAAQLTALGVASVRSPERSAETGALLKTKGRIFVPVTATQVLRQRANPS